MRQSSHYHNVWIYFGLILSAIVLVGCGLLSGLGGDNAASPTATPTLSGGLDNPPAEGGNPCLGLSGILELQLLVGPSEAVGLAPFTFAEVPFAVDVVDNTYLVVGNGPVQFYEDVYEADWGSFSVTFEGETLLEGTCLAVLEPGQLDVTITMTGQQTVVVTVEGMETSYPWTGSPTIEASLPLVDGAEAVGEGWMLILHLDG
jgi:hypothetical protein